MSKNNDSTNEPAHKVSISVEKLLRLKGAREAMAPKIGEANPNPTEPL